MFLPLHYKRKLEMLFLVKYVQLRAKQSALLVNKHYENEVTLK